MDKPKIESFGKSKGKDHLIYWGQEVMRTTWSE